MQFATHGNGRGLDDLYVLPDTQEESRKIWEYLRDNGISFSLTRSDVRGQSWFGKYFFDVPFGEGHKAEILAAVEKNV